MAENMLEKYIYAKINFFFYIKLKEKFVLSVSVRDESH